MDLLDRLLGHDAWTTRRLLLICRGLRDADLDRTFDLGHRTVRATLAHMISNVEVWSALIRGDPAAGAAGRGRGTGVRDLLRRHESSCLEFADVARDVARRDAWDERFLDTLDDPPAEKSRGGAIAHVLTHNMHHRAQVIHMLKRLGVPDVPEGDVLSWERGQDPG